MSTQIRALAPATRVMSRNDPPTAASGSWPSTRPAPAWFASTFATACGRWLVRATSRSCASGVDRDRPRAEAGDEPVQPCGGRPDRSGRGRREEPRRAREEVGARVAHAARLRPAHRVAADEAAAATRPPPSAGTSSSRRPRRRSPRPVASSVSADELGQVGDRPAHDGDVRVGDGALERLRDAGPRRPLEARPRRRPDRDRTRRPRPRAPRRRGRPSRRSGRGPTTATRIRSPLPRAVSSRRA